MLHRAIVSGRNSNPKKILELSQAPSRYIRSCIFVLHTTGTLVFAPLGQTFPLEIVGLTYVRYANSCYTSSHHLQHA